MAVVERMRAVREVIAGVDPGGLSARDAEELLAESVALSNAAQALAARAARRVGETGAHRRAGDPTEAHYLTRVAGVGVGVARQALAVADAVAGLEATRAELAVGNLSMRQADAIAAAATVAPEHEARLLRAAQVRGVTQLEEECARIRAAAAPVTAPSASNATTAPPGPTPTSPSSTTSTGSAPHTTNSRPTTTGHSSTAPGSDPSSHPTTHDTQTGTRHEATPTNQPADSDASASMGRNLAR